MLIFKYLHLPILLENKRLQNVFTIHNVLFPNVILINSFVSDCLISRLIIIILIPHNCIKISFSRIVFIYLILLADDFLQKMMKRRIYLLSACLQCFSSVFSCTVKIVFTQHFFKEILLISVLVFYTTKQSLRQMYKILTIHFISTLLNPRECNSHH